MSFKCIMQPYEHYHSFKFYFSEPNAHEPKIISKYTSGRGLPVFHGNITEDGTEVVLDQPLKATDDDTVGGASKSDIMIYIVTMETSPRMVQRLCLTSHWKRQMMTQWAGLVSQILWYISLPWKHHRGWYRGCAWPATESDRWRHSGRD